MVLQTQAVGMYK